MRLFSLEHMTEKGLIYHVYKEVPQTEKTSNPKEEQMKNINVKLTIKKFNLVNNHKLKLKKKYIMFFSPINLAKN